MVKVRQADADDIGIIHQLAHDIWPVAYKEILSNAQLEYMLDMMYSHQALKYQIVNQGHEFFLLSHNDKPVGFASIQPKYKISEGLYRLNKLYVLPTEQGKGFGQLLLSHIISFIKPKGAFILELNVNRNNKAVTFYEKQGFKIIREEDIAIGKGYFMNDYVMQKEIPDS